MVDRQNRSKNGQCVYGGPVLQSDYTDDLLTCCGPHWRFSCHGFAVSGRSELAATYRSTSLRKTANRECGLYGLGTRICRCAKNDGDHCSRPFCRDQGWRFGEASVLAEILI